MIQQSDIPGRLRLLRYGLIVTVVVTFLVAWLAPYAEVRPVIADLISKGVTGLTQPGIFDNLGWAALATIVVAALAVITYFAYKMILERRSK